MTFTVLRDDVPLFPKIKLYDREGDTAFNALDSTDTWAEAPAAGDYISTAWIPANFLNEGLVHGRRRDVQPGSLGRVQARASRGHDARPSPSTFTTRARATRRGAASRAIFAGPVRPLLEWTTERR